MSQALFRTLLAVAVVVAVAVAGLPAGAHAQMASDNVFRDFLRSGDFTLVVDGKEMPAAEIYKQDTLPALLIITSALPSPVLVTPRTGAVETVNLMKVAKQLDGSVDLLADATLAPQGQIQVDGGGDVTFTVDGHKVQLKQRPPLLGLKRSGDLKTYDPAFLDRARAYHPDGQVIAQLKKTSAPVTVRVFFGSWCPHCQHFVPRVVRVDDELKGSKVKFEYYGLPQEKMSEDPEAKKVNVKGVPTGIVYVNGKEMGRIQGNSWDAPEESLSGILSAAKAVKNR
jgi:thiol-disulfide isomerase/thioredoxin